MSNGNRATLQDTENVTLCTERETKTSFRCTRHENMQNEKVYVNLKGIGSIKSVRIFAEGNFGFNFKNKKWLVELTIE